MESNLEIADTIQAFFRNLDSDCLIKIFLLVWGSGEDGFRHADEAPLHS
jgi:hypothetical protein